MTYISLCQLVPVVESGQFVSWSSLLVLLRGALSTGGGFLRGPSRPFRFDEDVGVEVFHINLQVEYAPSRHAGPDDASPDDVARFYLFFGDAFGFTASSAYSLLPPRRQLRSRSTSCGTLW